MKGHLQDLEDQIRLTRQAYAEGHAFWEATVVEFLYLMAMTLIALAKK